MRLILNIRAVSDFSYDLNYYYKMQGFIYDLMKDTPYSSLHEKKGYKFFCFSNIFPIPENLVIKKDELKNFLISSPDRILILFLKKKFNEIREEGKQIFIGNMIFKIENIKVFNQKINKNLKLRSATPIIVRIPERNYERYCIPLQARKKRFLYWRPEYPFEAFIKQLEENLIKKYNEFYGKCAKDIAIFEIYKFIKGPIVSKVVIHGKEYSFIGSSWEFKFNYLTKEKQKILKFGMDCGFGERNSFGFGFMNVVR